MPLSSHAMCVYFIYTALTFYTYIHVAVCRMDAAGATKLLLHSCHDIPYIKDATPAMD